MLKKVLKTLLIVIIIFPIVAGIFIVVANNYLADKIEKGKL